MNLTIKTAWVIVDVNEQHLLFNTELYRTKATATRHIPSTTPFGFSGLKVVPLKEHIDAVYELGRSNPSFM